MYLVRMACFSLLPQSSPELAKEPEQRNNQHQPWDDSYDCAYQPRRANRQIRTGLSKGVPNRRPRTSIPPASLDSKCDFDRYLLGFIGQNFALCGFPI